MLLPGVWREDGAKPYQEIHGDSIRGNGESQIRCKEKASWGFIGQKKKKKKDRAMSTLGDIQNLPGKDQEQCDLPSELALPSS